MPYVVCNLAVVMAKRKIRTITQLSKMTGLSRLSLDKCYHDKAKIMCFDTAYKLCIALDCELDELYIMVDDEEYRKRQQRKKEREQKLKKGFVYFLKNPADGLIKIGRSSDVGNRIKQLSKELDQPLELITKIPLDDSVKGERDLHKQFAHYRVHGEWFDLPDMEFHKITSKER